MHTNGLRVELQIHIRFSKNSWGDAEGKRYMLNFQKIPGGREKRERANFLGTLSLFKGIGSIDRGRYHTLYHLYMEPILTILAVQS